MSAFAIDGEVILLSDPRLAHGFHELEIHGERSVRWMSGHSVVKIKPMPIAREMAITVAVIKSDGSSLSPTWKGMVDLVQRNRVAGWAWDGEKPDETVILRILANDVQVARIWANRYDPTLSKNGIGNGRHGFDVTIPGGFSPLIRHVICIRREADDVDLPGSPIVIEAACSFDPNVEAAIADMISAVIDDKDQRRILHFLVTQTDRLLQQRADADGQREERRAFKDFRRRWGPAADAAIASDSASKRALVIDNWIPVVGRDAGSQAILSHIRAMQRLGYAVSFAAAEEFTTPSADFEAAEVRVYGAPFYASIEDVLRRQSDCFDLVYLHRVDVAARYLALIRRYSPRAWLIYSVADLHHIRLQRQSYIEERPELMAVSQWLRLAEFTAARMADAVITHSLEEVDVLRRAVPRAKVYQVPWELPVHKRNGLFTSRRGVAFIGSYTHSPNLDAAYFLVETVMPLVWRIDPTIECRLVGSAMTDAVAGFARPGIVVVGHVDDLRTKIFDHVRLTVAPLRYGAGVTGKVLESLAAGIPCVMSSIAAEGLTLPPILQALVSDDAATIAANICRLHADQSFNEAASTAGSIMMQQDFAEAVVVERLQAAIEGHT